MLSLAQLRLAFSTMLSCVSEKDDALAWYSISQLVEAISTISAEAPLSTPAKQEQTGISPLADLSVSHKEVEARKKASRESRPGNAADTLIADPATKLEDATVTDDLEARALKSRRGHLLVVLIDQLSTVNLCWLEPLADRVAWFLAEEKHSEPDARSALVQILYRTLAGGMDMTKRETAAKWWLANRRYLEEEERSLQVRSKL